MKKYLRSPKHHPLLAVAAGLFASLSALGSTVETYPLPASATVSPTYTMTANGVAVPVAYVATPGYNDQTHVANFMCSGTVPVVITASSTITSYNIKPSTFALSVSKSGHTLSFSVDQNSFAPLPAYIDVQINPVQDPTTHTVINDLWILVDPLEANVPPSSGAGIYNVTASPYNADPTGHTDATTAINNAISAASAASGTVYVPPGVYSVSNITLQNNINFYLAGGSVLLQNQTLTAALVQGSISNVTIHGHGWFDGNAVALGETEGGSGRSKLFAPSGPGPLAVSEVTFRMNASWNINPTTPGSTFTNVKIYGPRWTYTDGYDISGSDSTVDKCFVDTGDDAFCAKAKANGDLGYVLFSNSIARTNSALYKTGSENTVPNHDITFNNLRGTHGGRGLVTDDSSGSSPLSNITWANLTIDEIGLGGGSTDRRNIEFTNDQGQTQTNLRIFNVNFLNSYGTTWRLTGPITGLNVTDLVVAGTEVTGANETTYFNYGSNVTGVVYQSSGAGLVSGTTYELVNQYNSLALDSKTLTNGGPIVQWGVDGNPTQAWTIAAVGGGNFKLVNQNSGMALDNGSSYVAGAAMIQGTDVGAVAQKWRLNPIGGGLYIVTNAKSLMNLDGTSATGNGTPAVQWVPDNSLQQTWEIQIP